MLWVGFLSRFIAATFFFSPSCAHAISPLRALLRTATPTEWRCKSRNWSWRDKAKEDKRRREGGGEEEGQALVEVVVCAVGRVVILPLVEMTAQSTALPALVTRDGGVDPDPE